MSVWELKTASPDVYASLNMTEAQARSRIFVFDGKPREWKRRPTAEVYQEAREKDHLPRADISLMAAGSLVLNEKAAAALRPFLDQFGQFLEARVDGVVEYFFNVTNVVDCIDLDGSTRRSSGSIIKEAFKTDALPVGPAVFKDPRTALIRIYVNDAAREILEDCVASNQLTGMKIAALGQG